MRAKYDKHGFRRHILHVSSSIQFGKRNVEYIGEVMLNWGAFIFFRSKKYGEITFFIYM
jgi:hypothetical protein